MANKLYQQMQQVIQPQNNVMKLINLMKSGGNPNELLNVAIQSNPQASQLINEMKSSGITPKDFFMQKANQMGVNPNSILNMLK